VRILRLSYRRDGSIGADVVTPASPVDGSGHIARDEYCEAQQVSQRTEPNRTLAPTRQPINLYRNKKAARKRRKKDHPRYGAEATQQQRRECKRQWMRDHRACVAGRIDKANRSCPAKFVRQKLPERVLAKRMANGKGRDSNLKPELPDRVAHGVVIGESISKSFKPSDSGEGASPERDGRSEARFGEAERRPDEHAREKMLVYLGRSHPRPKTCKCAPTIEAGNEAYSGLLQDRKNVTNVIGLDPDIAIAENDDIVLCQRENIENICDFRISPRPHGRNDEFDVTRRKLLFEVANHCDRGVRCILDSAKHLDPRRLVLGTERSEADIEPVLGAVEGLQQRDIFGGTENRLGLAGKSCDQKSRRQGVDAADYDDKGAYKPQTGRHSDATFCFD
jgi:hypothetical protein